MNPSEGGNKLDRAAILERMEGSQELMTELIQLFLGEVPYLVETMRKTLNEGDMQELGRSAHSLKGAASNFSAHETVMVAAQLEYDAKNGDAESAKASLSTLVVVVERLLRDLANLCQESQQ